MRRRPDPARRCPTRPCLVVDDPLVALGRLARDQVDRAVAGGLRVVGDHRSAGKTSTKDLLAQVLETAGPTVAPVGNLNNELGLPLTVCRIEGRPGSWWPRWALAASVTSPTCARSRRRRSPRCSTSARPRRRVRRPGAIALAKGEIVEALPADGTAVLNADDPLVWAMRTRTAARVSRISVQAEPDEPDAVWASDVDADALGRCAIHACRAAAGWPSDTVRVRLGVAGRHQVANAVAAAAWPGPSGSSSESVAAALSAARARSRWRMELTERDDGVWSSTTPTTPTRSRCALPSTPWPAVPAAEAGRSWAVLGDMLELGSGRRASTARWARWPPTGGSPDGGDRGVRRPMAGRPGPEADRQRGGAAASRQGARSRPGAGGLAPATWFWSRRPVA